MSYPAARYHETLPCRLVHNEDDDAKLLAQGFRNKPFPPPPPPPPVLTPLETLTAERDELLLKLAEVTQERDTLALEMPRLMREMDAIKAGMARAKAKAKPEEPQKAENPEAK